MNLLPFEKPIADIEKRIAELEKESKEKNIDLSSSIDKLRNELEEELERIFSNLTPWEIVQVTRHPDRPRTMDYVKYLIPDYVYFCGDRLFKEDSAIFGGLGTLDNQTVMLIGHNKGKNTRENLTFNFGMANPEGYRKALRLMHLAEKFNAPIITLIDTPGAYPGIEAEEHGQAEAIARNLQEMFSINVPIICVVIGEGGSGGALGIGISDRLLMMEFAVYSVISPEGCASILWRDSTKAEKAAELLKITAKDLLNFGIIDKIIKEPIGGAHRNQKAALQKVKEEIILSLAEIKAKFGDSKEDLLSGRYRRFQKIASYDYVSSKVAEKTED
jgi:acetyl-CoA carboxylase carboxyl transferase subunit alpha